MTRLATFLLFVCFLSSARVSHAQVVRCTLQRVLTDSTYTGGCLRDTTVIIQLSLETPKTGSNIWRGRGTISGEPWAYPMFLEVRQDGGTFGQFRGWREVLTADVDSQTLRFEYDRSRETPLRASHLTILRRARALLKDSTRWNRQDTRDSIRPNNCVPPRDRRSLFCALHDASVEVLGDFYGGPFMDPVFEGVYLLWGEARHPLQAFNNDASTTLADIHAVLDFAVRHVEESRRLQARRARRSVAPNRRL
jgi:hypothetical protein